MSSSLTPTIVGMQQRMRAFANAIQTQRTSSDAIRADLNRLHREHDGGVLPASDPNIVSVRQRVQSVADALDAAIAVVRTPADWQTDTPYRTAAERARSLAHQLERRHSVNLHGLASDFGRVTTPLGTDNAQLHADHVDRAVSLITDREGVVRQVSAGDLHKTAERLADLSVAYSGTDLALRDAIAGAHALVDRRNTTTYQDDLLYVADIRDTIAPAVAAVRAEYSGLAARMIPDMLHASRTGASEQKVVAALDSATTLMNTVISAREHEIPAAKLLDLLNYAGSRVSVDKESSPARVALHESRLVAGLESMATRFAST